MLHKWQQLKIYRMKAKKHSPTSLENIPLSNLKELQKIE
jgi:hypothetical protein